MSDDLERQLRERLHRAILPSAPVRLRMSVESIVQTPVAGSPRRDRRRTLGLLAIAAVVAGGGLAVLTVGRQPNNDALLDPTAGPSASPLATASSSPEPSDTPGPSGTATASPPTASPALPSPTPPLGSPMPAVAGAARQIGEQVVIAPGRDGTLFVAIPDADGAIVARLDQSGRPHAGWPITVSGTISCPVLLPVDDGSVRVVCQHPRADLQGSDAHAFAFDADGRSMAGWPVDLGPTNEINEPARYTGRMVGTDLTVSMSTQTAYDFVRVLTVAEDGTIRPGAGVNLSRCCPLWAIGPDGNAYGVAPPRGAGSPEVSNVTSMDLDGRRSGWPVTTDGVASGPAFGPDGRILVTVGSADANHTLVNAFDTDGTAISASSQVFPMMTAATIDGCNPVMPAPPVVAGDGTSFIYSGVENQVHALDPSLEPMRGWPYEATKPLAPIGYDDPNLSKFCPSVARPAVGPDSTLYLSLQARNKTVGGSLVAVAPNGKVRSGWPVELTKAGSAFWSIVVGSDGTVYALAVEPEAGNTSSATILAIAPDSTVRYSTTIIEP